MLRGPSHNLLSGQSTIARATTARQLNSISRRHWWYWAELSRHRSHDFGADVRRLPQPTGYVTYTDAQGQESFSDRRMMIHGAICQGDAANPLIPRDLIGRPLTSVVFVMDYLQLVVRT